MTASAPPDAAPAPAATVTVPTTPVLAAPVLAARGIERLHRSGDGAFALRVEHVALAPGDRVAVTGPSGCGKSTLLALLGLVLRPDEPGGGAADGRLEVCGTDALPLWRAGRLDALAALRGARVGFVPQTGALLPYLTLRDNIALPQRVQGRPDPARAGLLAERLGIAGVLGRLPRQVSVGQRQRAAVARALAHGPALVLADEPTASVHPAAADEVLALLLGAASESGAALVIATHDEARARAAGFAVAPCRPNRDAARTSFAWPA